jgi:hypothetical protein
MERITSRLGFGIALVVMWFAVDMGTAVAHGGHTHGDEGFDATVIVQVAVTVAVLAGAYLIAGTIVRRRTPSTEDTDADR